MDLKIVRLVFAKEIRDILRDRRSLFVMVVLPLLLYPVLLLGYSQLVAIQQSKLQSQAGRVALFDAEHAPALAARIAESTAFEIVHVDSRETAEAQLRDGDLDLIVAIPNRFDARLAAGEQIAWNGTDEPGNGTLTRNSAQERSRVARVAFGELLDDAVADVRAARMRALGTSSGIDNVARYLDPITTEWRDIASGTDRAGYLAARLLPFVLLVTILSGAFFCALDISAGEKERGTLETLLVTPAARRDIVAGKMLTVLAVASASALLNVLSLALTVSTALPAMGAGQSGIAAAGLSVRLSVWQTIALAGVVVPAAGLFSAISLGLSAYAKTYKEGQYYLTPMLLVAMPLSLVAALPGTSLDQLTALVPIANVALAIKAIVGESAGGVSGVLLLLTIGVTLACMIYAIRWTVSLFAREDVLFRDAPIGFRWRFWEPKDPVVIARDRTRLHSGHAVLLVALALAGSAMVPALVPMTGKVPRLLVHYLVFHIALTVMMIRATGNRVAEVLPLPTRPTHLLLPLVMLPALVFLVNVMLAALGALWPSITEGMRRTTEVYLELTRGLGAGGTLLFLAILPGICEEVVFRGFVYRAFRNYRGATGAVLISAALFALIHDMSQWGYAFTMGMLLGFLRARTGSLTVPIALHVGFNTLVLMTTLPGWPLELPDRTLSAGELALWGTAALAIVGGVMALMMRLTRDVPAERLDGGPGGPGGRANDAWSEPS